MSKDVLVSRKQIHNCLIGVLMHLRNSGIANNYCSFSEAMHDLGLWDFAFNQAEVIAYQYAYIRKLDCLLLNNGNRYG